MSGKATKAPAEAAPKPKGPCFYKQITMWLEILIIILVIWLLSVALRPERLRGEEPAYLGGGLNNAVYTSGATMRRLGQVFSSTDQGQTTTIYNDEIRDAGARAQNGVPVVMYKTDQVPPALLKSLQGY